ncbi:hypothetical protein M2475_001746 [Breznakia sp. PF5-3]|uniref:hypothetical protein n=1 Tax=unclassified Breznakia TaxID=2623764 RepID=UPI0024054136|nr:MULTISPECIES: hypothetical protein [unclassified Breznakia]MDF9825284.1 hypothetical protein [Breznakia sp. PM6-1]MDF9836170.1 hypothetical protein [Breznakia sp. PF5-3]MDF9837384.1 hypothetical protein [Breznakia sp. PFB2-8]MDF9859319.1 hypothetical protein [Breznakia sp. PH5-24]
MATLYLIISIIIFICTCFFCFIYLRRRNAMRREALAIYEEVQRHQCIKSSSSKPLEERV